MEEESYGVYSTYFAIVKNFGAFPYNLEGRGKRLRLCTEGPYLWLYLIQLAAGTFHAFFQLFQLILVFLEGENNFILIGQFTWTLLGVLPVANFIKAAGEEGHFASVVNEWCLLERRIIGSNFRGLGFGKKGAPVTLSTCHFKQKDRFIFISRYYIFLGIIGAVAVGCHATLAPDFPSYMFRLFGNDSDALRNLSVVYQLWIYCIIWSNIYMLEVLTTAISGSVGHILETLSYKGGVVMTRWTCDEIPVLDLKSFSDKNDEDENRPSSMAVLNKANRKGSLLTEDIQELFPKTQMSRIIQNLVDIEFGLENYLRVESLIEAFNHSFGRMIPGHQFVYLLMLTIQGFNAVQYFSDMQSGGVIIYVVLVTLFIMRMLTFFPAMGNLDHRSDSFIDSWMEGLRYVPKGKQSYELYWYRIKSCRLLDFRCGRYFNMERQTCLEFLFRVSEFVIVLMQINY